ncbi:hypothetical protein Bbelb_018170 [Branchiostoma belcheri]|nr:hypothetical protein Bbelb_018170 [Branchiostoma belcheri]
MRKGCFPGNPRNITKRRLWGQYIHTIRDHTPVLYRIAAISTLMVENEERHFSTFKRITKTSANYANPGYDFAKDKFPYMKKVATEEEEEEHRRPPTRTYSKKANTRQQCKNGLCKGQAAKSTEF